MWIKGNQVRVKSSSSLDEWENGEIENREKAHWSDEVTQKNNYRKVEWN